MTHILRNRVYVGDAMHKGIAHPGEHEAIISRELFDAVQAKLAANRTSYERRRTIGSDALLTGLIFDDRANAMSPMKSRRPGGRFYLYYVNRWGRDGAHGIGVSALKPGLANALAPELSEASLRERIRELVVRVVVGHSQVAITVDGKAVAARTGISLKQSAAALRTRLPSGDNLEADDHRIVLTIPVRLRLRGGIKRVEGWDQSDWTTAKPRHDPALLKALAQAHEWCEWIEAGTVVTLADVATRSGHDRTHTHKILKLAFLAPDIQRAILTGRQHKCLTLAALTEADLPTLWADQRTLLCTV